MSHSCINQCNPKSSNFDSLAASVLHKPKHVTSFIIELVVLVLSFASILSNEIHFVESSPLASLFFLSISRIRREKKVYFRRFTYYQQADPKYSTTTTSTTTTMKFLLAALLCFTFLIGENLALHVENYTADIEELMRDEKFMDEYAKWSFKLFSQPDYLYGDLNKTFPCSVIKDSTVPTSVHQLRPSDIKCIGAMGDSLTAGLGAHAITPVGLFFENRGATFADRFSSVTLHDSFSLL